MKFEKKNILYLLVILQIFLGMKAWGAVQESPFPKDINVGLLYNDKEYKELLEEKDTLSSYRLAIEKANGNVVVLTTHYSEDHLQRKLDKIDALLIPGGDDIDPKYYGEERNNNNEFIDSKFDAFEIEVLDFVKTKKLPILGVCRGEQLLNVYFGGSLYQDIPTQFKATKKVVHRQKNGDRFTHPRHEVRLKSDSILFSLLGEQVILTNSYHHQGVKKLAPDFVVTGITEDGMAEVIEAKEKNILGIQFHPELLRLEDPTYNKVFTWLVEKGRELENKP